MSIDVLWKRVAVAALGCVLLAGCGETGGEATVDTAADTEMAADAAPAPEVAAQPATIAELFPEGEGKQIVLANCASCHAVACTVIGQRPDNRWTDLRDAHAEHVPSLSAEQRETAFAYLAENFGADDPEPNVPPEFLARGCTPF